MQAQVWDREMQSHDGLSDASGEITTLAVVHEDAQPGETRINTYMDLYAYMLIDRHLAVQDILVRAIHSP